MRLEVWDQLKKEDQQQVDLLLPKFIHEIKNSGAKSSNQFEQQFLIEIDNNTNNYVFVNIDTGNTIPKVSSNSVHVLEALRLSAVENLQQ